MPEQSTVLDDWRRRLNAFGKAKTPCFFVVDFEQRMPRVWSDAEADVPAFRFPGGESAWQPQTSGAAPGLEADFPSKERFQEAFAVVQKGLQRGDSFLTNLTFPIPIRLTGNLEEVYASSQAKYRILFPGRFTCFSPETFVTIRANGYIESRPMKGTALDTEQARRALLHSPKEIAEHATIVDLIRNDLNRVAKRVRVTDYRYLHRIANSRRGLVQSSSNIGGELPSGWKAELGDILVRLLPAGSVSGAPKPATLDLIRRAEGGDRGYYCGVAGYFNGRQFDSCVMIRFIERTAAGAYLFRSGGGITAQSNWEDEYHELLNKVRIPTRDPVSR